MRRHTLFAAAALLALSVPAHAAQPGLNLQALHLDGVIRDVAFPLVLPLANNLVGGLAPLAGLEGLHLNGLVVGVVSDVALPLVGALTSYGLPVLPPLAGLEGLKGVVGVVITDVALPTVGEIVRAVD